MCVIELALPALVAIAAILAVMRRGTVDPLTPELVRALGGADQVLVDLELGRWQVARTVFEVPSLATLVLPLEVARVAVLQAAVLGLDARIVTLECLCGWDPEWLVDALAVLVDEIIPLPPRTGHPLGRRDIDSLAQWQTALADSRPG